jgi:uncharacterized sulfatase
MTAGGCTIEPEIQGRALQNISASGPWREEVYIQISECYMGRAVRTNQYKYVIHAPECNPWKTLTTNVWHERYLFDLRNDPLERNNLLRDPDYAKIKEDMKQRIVRCAHEAGENFTEILP